MTRDENICVVVGACFETYLLEYFDETERFHYRYREPEVWKIYRSLRFDHCNRNDRLASISLIVDSSKPQGNNGWPASSLFLLTLTKIYKSNAKKEKMPPK